MPVCIKDVVLDALGWLRTAAEHVLRKQFEYFLAAALDPITSATHRLAVVEDQWVRQGVRADFRFVIVGGRALRDDHGTNQQHNQREATPRPLNYRVRLSGCRFHFPSLDWISARLRSDVFD